MAKVSQNENFTSTFPPWWFSLIICDMLSPTAHMQGPWMWEFSMVVASLSIVCAAHWLAMDLRADERLSRPTPCLALRTPHWHGCHCCHHCCTKATAEMKWLARSHTTRVCLETPSWVPFSSSLSVSAGLSPQLDLKVREAWTHTCFLHNIGAWVTGLPCLSSEGYLTKGVRPWGWEG